MGKGKIAQIPCRVIDGAETSIPGGALSRLSEPPGEVKPVR